MISALTSTLSATLSSVSTLFTMDFYSRYIKVNDSKKMVRVGQIASFVALIIAVSWAPFIQKFDSLVGYYQEMVSYIAPPIVGAFFIGVFWKRANAIGAFTGLMFGLVVAFLIMGLKYGLGINIGIHYLMLAPLLMILSMIVMAMVSIFTALPPTDKVEANTWKIQIWKDETKELKGIVWYKNFRVLCAILAVLCLVEYLIFL